MALLLALAVNVGVGTMVESFSRTFIGWLDGRLAADVYISAADNAQGAAIRNWLKRAQRRRRRSCRADAPRRRSQARRSSSSACPITPPIASAGRCWRPRRVPGRAACPAMPRFSANNWRAASTSASAIVIEVPAPGGTWQLDVVGIYADYGNPKGQLAVNVAALIRHFRRRRRRASACASRRRISRPDRGAAEAVRSRRPQRRRSGDGEGGIDPHLQPHLCGDRRR